MTLREIADMLSRLQRSYAHQYPALLLREQAGLTQAQVAELVGASQVSVHRWETGQKFPRSVPGRRWAAQIRDWAREAWWRDAGLNA